jgi:hypothetical protein
LYSHRLNNIASISLAVSVIALGSYLARVMANPSLQSLKPLPITPPPKPVILQGRIEVENVPKLKPITLPFKVGDIYKKENMPKLNKYKNWWTRIPPWLAGLWESQTEHYYYVYDYKTKKADHNTRTDVLKAEPSFGLFIDAKGGIWHHIFMGVNEQDEGQNLDVQLVRDTSSGFPNDKIYVERNRYIKILVDKASKRIKSIEQAETIQTAKPITKNLIRVDSIAQLYDLNGKALRQEKSYSILSRYTGPGSELSTPELLKAGLKTYIIRPGEPLVISPGKKIHDNDLAASLRDYLADHNMFERIPFGIPNRISVLSLFSGFCNKLDPTWRYWLWKHTFSETEE